MSPYRVHVRIGESWRELPAGSIRTHELKVALGIDPARRLRLEEPGDPRLLLDDETIELYPGMAFGDVEWLRYVPSSKHKSVPTQGVKGTICPEDVDLGRAQELLEASVPDTGRKRWATDGDRFFAAHPDGAGGWHGWPEPVERVPVEILRAWRAAGKVS
jgi:hypothetical protein